MAATKPRIIKSYEKIDEKLREAIAAKFPLGYASEIQTFDIGGGKFMSALPFETEDANYLIKFPVPEDVPDDSDDNMGNEEDLNLEGGEDVDEEEEQDEVEKPMDNIEDLDVADEN